MRSFRFLLLESKLVQRLILWFTISHEDHSRKVVAISEVIGVEAGEIIIQPLYEFVEEGEDNQGKIIGELKPTENKLKNRLKLELAGLSE